MRKSLREFGLMNLDGYKFVFRLDNQTKKFKNRCWCVVEERIVFDRKSIALNPDIIRFSNGSPYSPCGSHITIDCVSYVDIRDHYEGAGRDFYFDIVCDGVGDLAPQKITFLAVSDSGIRF